MENEVGIARCKNIERSSNCRIVDNTIHSMSNCQVPRQVVHFLLYPLVEDIVAILLQKYGKMLREGLGWLYLKVHYPSLNLFCPAPFPACNFGPYFANYIGTAETSLFYPAKVHLDAKSL